MLSALSSFQNSVTISLFHSSIIVWMTPSIYSTSSLGIRLFGALYPTIKRYLPG